MQEKGSFKIPIMKRVVEHIRKYSMFINKRRREHNQATLESQNDGSFEARRTPHHRQQYSLQYFDSTSGLQRFHL